MVDIAVILGADKIRAEEELKESLEFEMKLANVGFSSISFINKPYIEFYVGTHIESYVSEGKKCPISYKYPT